MLSPKSPVVLTQASWTRFAFLAQDVLSKWAVGGTRGVQDVARPDPLIVALHVNLLDRGTVPALQRESVAAGFSLALQLIEGTFQFRNATNVGGSESPQATPSIDVSTVPIASSGVGASLDGDMPSTGSSSPTSVASPPPPKRVDVTAPSSPMSLGGRSNHVASQVTTIRGVVLSPHVFSKCQLRLALTKAHRRISELITERDDICRELVRVGASSRLLPTLLSSSPTVVGGVATTTASPQSLSVGERRRLRVARLLWSMTSTWQRLEREQREQQLQLAQQSRAEGVSAAGDDVAAPRQLTDDTFELLNGWLTAAEVYSMRSTSSVLVPPGSRQGQDASRSNINSRGGQLRLLDDDDDDLGAALGLPAPLGHTQAGQPQKQHYGCGDGSVYMPIFLCRRCRGEGRGNLVYDAAQQRLVQERHRQPQSSRNQNASHQLRENGDVAPSPHRAAAAAALTARLVPSVQMAAVAAAPPHVPTTPPASKTVGFIPSDAVEHRGSSPLRPKPPAGAATPHFGGVLPLIPNPTSLRQRTMESRTTLVNGGNSPRQQRRLWESTAHGVYVPHR